MRRSGLNVSTLESCRAALQDLMAGSARFKARIRDLCRTLELRDPDDVSTLRGAPSRPSGATLDSSDRFRGCSTNDLAVVLIFDLAQVIVIAGYCDSAAGPFGRRGFN